MRPAMLPGQASGQVRHRRLAEATRAELVEFDAALTPQAATNSGHRHGAVLSASATAAAAAHRATARQPVKPIRSVPSGGNEGASPTAHQTRTAP